MSAVDARINYTGTEEGAEQLDKLVRVLAQLVASQDRAASSTAKLEDELRDEAKATREAEEASKKKTAASEASAASAEALGQKVGQVGGAMGALGAQLGQVSPQMGRFGGALGAVGTAATATTGAMGPFGLALAAVSSAVTIGIALSNQHAEAMREQALAAQEAKDALDRLAIAMGDARRTEDLFAGLLSPEETRRQLDTFRDRFEATGVTAEATRRNIAEAREELAALNREAAAPAQMSEADLRSARLGGTAPGRGAEQSARIRELEQRITSGTAELRRLQDDLAASATQIEGAQRALEIAETRAETEARNRRRSGARRPANDNAISEEGKQLLEAARVQEEAAARAEAHEQRMLEYIRERGEALKELAQKEAERTEREAQAAMELAEQRKEAAQALADKEDELAQKRLEQAREITGAIEGTLQQVAAAYIDAFGQAIEGQKTLEAAALDATKALLKSIGEEMVALGIKETLEGFANIVANPPVAATKIPMGIALIAAGAGLGAAGAAIPSQPAAPAERPRSDTDRGGGDAGQTIIINNNQPVISAGTDTQLARRMVRQIDRGRGIGSTRRAAA